MPRSQDIFRANPPLTLTRRRSLQILMAGGLTALLPSELWLTGCGGVSSLLTGHLVNLTPTRIAIPVGGYGFIRASADGSVASENLFRLGITLPPSVEEVNPSVPVTLHVNVLHAMAAATPGRYLCGLRVKPRSDVDGTAQDEPFEIIVIPANQSIGLTIGPYGTFAGPASPGGGSQFAVTATATQRVLPSEWPGAQAQAGFTGEVRFRLEGLPTGISGGFSRPSVTLGEGSNGDRGVEEATILTISVGSAVAVGTYPFTVLADHDTPTKTARIQGNLVVVTAGTATPTPVPTPRPTPSPTPAPSPTPGPTTTGLIFSDVTAPVDSRTIDREGTFRLSDGGRLMTVSLAQSDTILRHIDIEIHSTTPLGAGMTAQILYDLSAPRRASFEFTQEGGTPYYQRYKAAAFGSLHIEAGPGNKLRIDIDGSLHLLPNATGISGTFNLRGSMILRPE